MTGAVRRSGWRRFGLAHLAMLPAVGLACVSASPWAVPVAALWVSLVAVAAMDSQGRWRNRWLMLLAVAWLVAAGIAIRP